MADIDIKQPAKINRNTAADGDFLWEKDFKVLYENDEKLKNAIQQATQDYTAGDGIDIDPSTKTISVKTGTGIEKTEEGLSVNIEGVDGAKVELNGNTYKVSAYNAEPAIEGLNDNLEDLQNELDAFEQEVAEKYITSGNEMVPNHQYVYTTSGWADIGGEHATVSYWRPTYNESTGKLSWQMSPSIEAPDDALVKGDKGDDGKTPEFRINQSTNFWEWKYTDAQNWTSTNTSATGPQGSKGEQGDQGYTPEISTAIDTEHSGTKVTFSWPEGSQLQPTEFTIPSGTPGAPGINGTNGTNGTDGITPKLRVDSSTNRWQVSYDNGSNWADISPATSATGPKGDRGPEPTIQAVELSPTSEHLNGGVEWTIKYPGMAVEAIGQIWNGNNGEDGSNSVYTRGPYLSGHGGDPTLDPVGLTDKAIEAIEAVSGKVSKPTASQQQLVYVVWDKGPAQNWTDFGVAANSWANTFLFDEEYPIVNGNNGLSAGLVPGEYNDVYVVGVDTTNMNAGNQYAFTTNGWEKVAVPSTSGYLPTSGGTVSGQVVLSATTSTFDQSYLKCINNANVGHAIFGLGSQGGAVIKTVNGNNESVQVNVNAGSNNSQLINVKTNNGTTDVGYLIPAKIEQAGWTPSADDKILHIVLES